jgi:hypothetical protein
LRSAGVTDLPTRFEQNAQPGRGQVGPLTRGFLSGDSTQGANLVVSAFVAKDCLTEAKIDAAATIQAWLAMRVDHVAIDGSALPPALATESPPEQTAALLAAVATLRSPSCASGGIG